MAKEAQTKKKPNRYLYGFTREQQEKIQEFSEITNILEICKTDNLNVEIKYTVGKKKSILTAWIDEKGSDFDKTHNLDTGNSIDLSLLTLEDYLEIFPFENIVFATSAVELSKKFEEQKSQVIETLKQSNGLSEKDLAQKTNISVSQLREIIERAYRERFQNTVMGADRYEFGRDLETNTYWLYFNGGTFQSENLQFGIKSDLEMVGRPVEASPERAEYQFADVSRIKPSPTNPRRRFNDESLAELAENIKKNGLINPITVRGARLIESEFDYEIVAGERRWRASVIAGLDKIPVIHKDLTDEQVLEIQIHENLHREEVHPLDEAFAYNHLLQTLSITQEELALRVGKPEKFVRMRLKLNSLIPEAQEDLEANRITIKMALEIAKFDLEVQPKVLKCAFGKKNENGAWIVDKDDRKTFNNFLYEINRNILLDLSDAPFNIKATNLRSDGLACINCPERTGAKDSLFDEFKSDEDQCLNIVCFKGKSDQHTRNFYANANAEEIKNGAEANYKMRIISWYPSNQSTLNEFFRAKVLVDGDYKSVSRRCKNIEKGIYLDQTRKFGEIINLCANKSCKAHWSSSSSSDSNKGKDETEAKKERLERKQYLLDVRVGEPTRVEVIKLAAEQFSIYNSDSETVRTDGEYFVESLVRWFTLQNSRNEMTAKVIAEIIREWCGDIPKVSTYDFEFEKWLNFLNQQREKVRAAVYFLLVHAHKGEMFYDSKNDQTEIIAIAEKYKVNYKLVYAQNLFKKCSEDKQYKKFLDAAKVYWQAVERGEEMDKPIFFKLDE